MKKILVLGMGKVGSLVGVLLNDNFEVTALDQKTPHYSYELPFKCLLGDVTDKDFISELLKISVREPEQIELINNPQCRRRIG